MCYTVLYIMCYIVSYIMCYTVSYILCYTVLYTTGAVLCAASLTKINLFHPHPLSVSELPFTRFNVRFIVTESMHLMHFIETETRRYEANFMAFPITWSETRWYIVTHSVRTAISHKVIFIAATNIFIQSPWFITEMPILDMQRPKSPRANLPRLLPMQLHHHALPN